MVWYETFVLGIFAALTARNFAMGFKYMDRDIDALNPRTINRPNVDGRISASQMLVLPFANALGFIFVAYFINDLALQLSIPILIIIGSYSYFKRFSYLAHIILGISLALAPIAGVVAVSETYLLVNSLKYWSYVLGSWIWFTLFTSRYWCR